MEQMEELTADVATASYCDRNNGNSASSDSIGYGEEGNNPSLEEELSIKFCDSADGGGGLQRELMAK